MSDEINEFLRRAAERRARQLEQMKRQAAEQAARAQANQAPPPANPFGSLADTSDVVDAEIIEASPARSGSQEPPVNKGKRQKQKKAKRPEKLGNVAAQADAKMETHLHDKFDHQIGSIAAPVQSVTADINPELKTRPEETHPLLELLKNPQSIRSAFIFAELLRRPEERW
jgi:hypothetical protein